MSLVTIGMGDLRVSDDPEDVLVTYALGSCIAVLVSDPRRRVAGMIHYMLPQSNISTERAAGNPAMFADTGVPLLFQEMYRRSCVKAELIVKVAGGANVSDPNEVFAIGKRNYVVLRKMFWKTGVPIAAQDVGGTASRTARLHVGTGRVIIRADGGERDL